MPKPSNSQKSAFKVLQDIDPEAKIRWDEKTGAPARIRGALSKAQPGAPEEIAHQFLSATKGLYAMKAPEEELELKAVGTDSRGGNHVRFRQVYKGLPVFGGELIVHMDGGNAIRGVNGKYTPGIDLPDEPKITAEEAEETILGDAPDNKKRTEEDPLLLILVHEGESHLAWHMTVDGADKDLAGGEMPALWAYFLDALTGKVLWRYNNLQTHTRTTGTGKGKYVGNVTLNTLHNHTSGKYELEDQWLPTSARITTHDADGGFPPKPVSKDANNNWSAPSQGADVDCHYYTRMFYDYFLLVHGRDSYDGAGADMHIYAHVGNNWNNASWNGSYVKIGDGDGITYGPFCTLDIVAHEWTHAVTGSTANLIYYDESGALNESFSDVFAALIDDDWLQGEDNWLKTTAPAGRNLADPTNGGQYDTSDPIGSVLDGHQPDHTSDQYTGPADGKGVHINSGIMNKAAYLIATGGTHRGIKICVGLGRDVLGRLYYEALTNQLTASSDFSAMRDAVLAALDTLYLGDPRFNRWEAAIKNAFAAVGVGTAVTCPKICWIAPACPPSPGICRLAPVIICPPNPQLACPPNPQLACPPNPQLACPPNPITACPPNPQLACPPNPQLACPPNPIIACPPMPGVGCLPGPDPLPFQPKMKKKD